MSIITQKTMKKSITISVLLLLIVIAATTFEQQNRNWSGKYFYKEEDETFATYTLTIKNNDSCTYESEGIQTYFNVSCIGKVNKNKYEIYFVKTIDGAFYPSEWMDKNKPIITLYYKDNELYTDEGQLNKEVKGGQLLFKRK